MGATFLWRLSVNVQNLFAPHRDKNLLGLLSVVLSPTNLCNRQCFFCPRVDPDVYPNTNDHMTVQTAELLANELQQCNYQGLVSFSGYGEPLLNPNIGDLIHAFVSKQIDVKLISNGDRLHRGKITCEEIDSWNCIQVKFDCYDGQQQYDEMSAICENLQTPYQIKLYSAETGDVSKEKIDGIPLKKISNRAGTLFQVDTLEEPCFRPMYKPVIDWNGDVYVCCEDWVKVDVFGNIHEQSFSDIWWSEKFMQARRNLSQGHRQCLRSCATCNLGTEDTIWEKEAVTLWQKYL